MAVKSTYIVVRGEVLIGAEKRFLTYIRMPEMGRRYKLCSQTFTYVFAIN